MLRGAALRGVLRFVLVVVGLVIFDDVVLATKQGDHACMEKGIKSEAQWLLADFVHARELFAVI